MLAPLVISALIATLTVAVHMTGLGILMAVMRSRSRHIRPHENTKRQAAFIILIVLGLFLIHAVEIWSYAGLYLVSMTLKQLCIFQLQLSPRWVMAM
jgi:hypothetical protein